MRNRRAAPSAGPVLDAFTAASLPVPFSAPLVRGSFVRRYKRFFVDVMLEDGTPTTAHTANTGTMTGLLVPGAAVLMTRHDGGRRAFPLELEAIRPDDSWVACNTIRANRVAEAFLAAGLIEDLTPALGPLTREVPAGDGSRIDFALGDVLVEVKSVTLRDARQDGQDGARGLFPDAVSARGQKHLQVLIDHAARGTGIRAGLLFLVQRDDVDAVAAASAIDPQYARLLAEAARAGVVLRAAKSIVDVDAGGLRFGGLVPVCP
jgi:sugar fermentation stimulation protein A